MADLVLDPAAVQAYLANIDGSAKGLYDLMVQTSTSADLSSLVAYIPWYEKWQEFYAVARDFDSPEAGVEEHEVTQNAFDVVAAASRYAVALDGNPDTGADGWRQRYQKRKGLVVAPPVTALVRAPTPVEAPKRGFRWYHYLGGAAALYGLWWLVTSDDESADAPSPTMSSSTSPAEMDPAFRPTELPPAPPTDDRIVVRGPRS